MTEEEMAEEYAKELLPIIKAYSEGKTIQMKDYLWGERMKMKLNRLLRESKKWKWK